MTRDGSAARARTHARGRPLADRVEVAAPQIAALAVRALGLVPEPLRRRALENAFDRARDAFNRGDIEAVTALFAPDVEYVPPPALREGTIRGLPAVLDIWLGVFDRYPDSTIENLSLREAAPGRFVRTARLRHRRERGDGVLEYTIVQTTELRRGRVARQVNEAFED